MCKGHSVVTPVWCFIFLFILQIISPVALAKQRLMVFMLDGFRWDYFDREGQSGMKFFLRKSVRAEYLINSFPTISFPNYYTIMTGLYSEDHGFVDNNMYDPVHDTEFLMGGNPEHYAKYWWNDGEPIWITARKQGKKSYMYFWPGCEVTIRSHKPNYCREYKGPPSMSEFRDAIWDGLNAFLDDSADLIGSSWKETLFMEIPFDMRHTKEDVNALTRRNKIVELGRTPSMKMAFVNGDPFRKSIYFELTDKVGHMFGPNSNEMTSVLSKLGDALETMLIQMKIMHLTDDVNVMLVSDHGMTDISPKRVIDLNHVLNTKDIHHMYGSTFLGIWPHKNKIKKVYEDIKGFHKNLTVLYKHEIPDRWRLKNHYRVPPIVAVADLGYYIVKPPDKHFPKSNGQPLGGYHGYDNEYPDMRGIFVASGPEFRQNAIVPWINAVDIYQLMCKVLEIQPAKNSGDWSNVASMLVRAEPLPPPSPEPTSPRLQATTETTTTPPPSPTTTTATPTICITSPLPSTTPAPLSPKTPRAPFPKSSSMSSVKSSPFLSSSPVPPALPPVSTPAVSTETPPTSSQVGVFQFTVQPEASVTSLCRPILVTYLLAVMLIYVGILA